MACSTAWAWPHRIARLGRLRIELTHYPGEYVVGDVHTNSVEGLFGNVKTGMRGAYKHVSLRWLQSYLDEWAWRHNAQRKGEALFEQLLKAATT